MGGREKGEGGGGRERGGTEERKGKEGRHVNEGGGERDRGKPDKDISPPRETALRMMEPDRRQR